MNEVLFYQHKKNNILDQLINIFKVKGKWKLKDSTRQFLNQFEWPDIILADRKRVLSNPQLDGNAIDLLGSYSFNNGEEVGQVTLYKQTILRCSDDYLKSSGITSPSFEDRKKFIEILSEIVLIHEFVHWLVDVGESPEIISYTNTKYLSNKFLGDKERKYYPKLKGLKYDNFDEIAYHESLAQIFTNYYCNKIGGEHWAVFSWLEDQQPEQYKIYTTLFQPLIVNIEDSHLEQVFDLINFTREIDCQSFDVLKVLSTNYSENDKESKCRGFFEKIIKASKLKADCYSKVVELSQFLHPELVKENRGRITGKKFGL